LARGIPELKHLHESRVLPFQDVMPKGLLGLLLSAMLGATVTSMDAGLNKKRRHRHSQPLQTFGPAQRLEKHLSSSANVHAALRHHHFARCVHQ